jgi:hypothetical protein
MPFLGSELRCTSWRRVIGDDVFVGGHDLFLDQKVVVDGVWIGYRIAVGRAGFREFFWPHQRLRCRRIFLITKGSSVSAISLISFWPLGHGNGSLGHARQIRSRQVCLGSFRGGGGVLFGQAMQGDVSFLRRSPAALLE